MLCFRSLWPEVARQYPCANAPGHPDFHVRVRPGLGTKGSPGPKLGRHSLNALESRERN